MPMKNPPQSGGVVLRQCIEPLNLTITGAATALGVTRTTLSELVNGRRGISPEMAVRLSPKCSEAAPKAGSPSKPTMISPNCVWTASRATIRKQNRHPNPHQPTGQRPERMALEFCLYLIQHIGRPVIYAQKGVTVCPRRKRAPDLAVGEAFG